MALAANEWHFQRRHCGPLVLHGNDVVLPWQVTQRGASGSPRAIAFPWSDLA